MRDIVITILILGGIPFILRNPWIGIMYWAWIGLMNPHRQAWGFAYDFPFAQVVAIAIFIGMIFTKDERRWKGGSLSTLLVLFVMWMLVTTAFALIPESALFQLERVLKIQIMTFAAIYVLYTKRHAELLLLICALSIGYYGIKGGLFTIAHGGHFRVWGPSGSYVADNNALALAVTMTIPLFYYFYTQAATFFQHPAVTAWIKRACLMAMALCAISALGSQSRGAFLALSALGVFLWLKGQHKLTIGLLIVLAIPFIIMFMPESWEARMRTIETYEEDASAMGRLNTWTMLWNIAVDRPLVGAGFEPYKPWVFALYAPNPADIHSAHSIWFQVLGEQGFIGFGLFMSLWILAWRQARWIIAKARGLANFQWAANMARCIQLSYIAYWTGGTFLNLAYWDMPYFLLVCLIVTRHVMDQALENHNIGHLHQRNALTPKTTV